MNTSPCWIFSMPRSGSTFLCEMLNLTGLFDPLFAEYFNSTINKSTDIKKDFISNPFNYKFCKIQSFHFLKQKISFEDIKNVLGQVKIIKLDRINILDCIVSYCISYASSTYAISKNPTETALQTKTNNYVSDVNSFTRKNIPYINDFTINFCIDFVFYQKKYLNYILQNMSFLNINYEEISNDDFLPKIFDYLEIDKDNFDFKYLKSKCLLVKTPEKEEKKQLEKRVLKIITQKGIQLN
jgi:LPS sulfotransferase NodH